MAVVVISDGEKREMNEVWSGIKDPTLLVLRAHLYTEHVMERLLLAALPRGDRLLENGNLSYAQKVALVSALDCVEDTFISGLRGLNKIRNACSHERQKTITMADVDYVGRSFGSDLRRIKQENHGNVMVCLSATIGWVCGGLLHCAVRAENKAISAKPAQVVAQQQAQGPTSPPSAGR